MEIFNKPSNAFVANFIGGHNVLAIGSKLFAIREDRINLTQNGNSQVNAIEFLGANVKINVTYGKSGNLTVSQSDVLFAKAKIEVGDNVKVSWNKKDQLELVKQGNNKT
jgi:putative spermidine/putrescine transport system ATP-binding protein